MLSRPGVGHEVGLGCAAGWLYVGVPVCTVFSRFRFDPIALLTSCSAIPDGRSIDCAFVGPGIKRFDPHSG
jgi:hypothetical protein